MPQPQITGTPPILQFGGLALPNGQGAASQINLNDLTSWTWMGWSASPATGDDDYWQHVVGQSVWRAKGTFLGQDAKSRTLTFSMRYRETSNPLGVALQRLSSYGLQNLALDASATAIPAKFAGTRRRQLLLMFAPYYWSLDLVFQAPSPWWQDLSATTFMAAVALNGAGSATNTNVTYSGGIFAEPVWTLTIPGGNAAPIASFALSNSMSGETLTIPFPGNLTASTAWTITIDSGAMSVTDGSGHAYDVAGSFPNLYGPAGQVQQISATLTPASGTATGCTLTCSAVNRWLL